VKSKQMFPSFSYGGSVLSHLEKVQRLPADVQVDIAKRIDNYIKLARAANNEDLLAPLALGAMEEQAKAIGQGSTPQWTRDGLHRQLPRHGAMPRSACPRLPRSIGRESYHQRD
jgi:hypothetical protein